MMEASDERFTAAIRWLSAAHLTRGRDEQLADRLARIGERILADGLDAGEGIQLVAIHARSAEPRGWIGWG